MVMNQVNSLVKTNMTVSGDERIRLGKDDIHVWYAWLDRPVDEYQKTLSLEENDRARSFHHSKDKRYYIARHGILREILSRYTGIGPVELSFVNNGNGKPALVNAGGAPPELYFNQTHSGNLAVYAVTRLGKVGVDVEYIRDIPDITDIARNYFSRVEYLTLQSLFGDRKTQGFYNCWTRKEAFIKALGEGLYYPLDKFEVSLAPDEPTRLLSISDPEESISDWSMKSLILPVGFAGALVIKGKTDNITHIEWLN